jgi:nucleoside-diphosphate-sugar epimerase
MHHYDNLIVGSSGYIGSRLLPKLPSEKNFLVPSKSNFTQFLKSAESLKFKNVFWVAGSQLPADTFEYKLEEHPDLVNLQKLIKIVQKSQACFTFLSSGGCVYGPGSGVFTEASKTFPVNLYGELKLLSEQMIANNLNNYTILRVANVFGVGQKPSRSQGVIPHWLEAIRENRPLTVFGPTHSYRDYIDIDSVINAILLSSKSSTKGVFNIGSGTKVELATLIEIFEHVLGRSQSILSLNARTSDRDGYILDSKRAEVKLGWRKPQDILKLLEGIIRQGLNAN